MLDVLVPFSFEFEFVVLLVVAFPVAALVVLDVPLLVDELVELEVDVSVRYGVDIRQFSLGRLCITNGKINAECQIIIKYYLTSLDPEWQLEFWLRITEIHGHILTVQFSNLGVAKIECQITLPFVLQRDVHPGLSTDRDPDEWGEALAHYHLIDHIHWNQVTVLIDLRCQWVVLYSVS